MTITRAAIVCNKNLTDNGKSYADSLAERIADGVEATVCRGVSRKEISQRMGYESDTSLSKWSNGDATPGPENLGKLAKATGLSLDWLIAERGPMFAPTGEEAVRLEIIGKIADSTLDDEAVRRMVEAVSAPTEYAAPDRSRASHSSRRKHELGRSEKRRREGEG